MKVDVAAETLSKSVFESFLYLQTISDEFKNSGATGEYSINFNNAFDILNSKNDDALDFKRPLNKHTIGGVKEFVEKFEKYIRGLSVNNKKGKKVPIIESTVKTAYLGFICTLKNVLSLYEDLVESGIMSTIYTLRLSQDLLEILFGQIRSHLGKNSNPNVLQFKGALRKLLYQHEIKVSENANVLNNDVSMLFLSSKRKMPIEFTQSPLQVQESLQQSSPKQQMESTHPVPQPLITVTRSLAHNGDSNSPKRPPPAPQPQELSQEQTSLFF